MEDLTKHPRYDDAVRHAKALRGLYGHATAYLLVNLGLVGINAVNSPGQWWFMWPMFGWGIGLASHAASVLAVGSRFGRDWEERKVREFLQRDR